MRTTLEALGSVCAEAAARLEERYAADATCAIGAIAAPAFVPAALAERPRLPGGRAGRREEGAAEGASLRSWVELALLALARCVFHTRRLAPDAGRRVRARAAAALFEAVAAGVARLRAEMRGAPARRAALLADAELSALCACCPASSAGRAAAAAAAEWVAAAGVGDEEAAAGRAAGAAASEERLQLFRECLAES
jgi:hypothetical protein